VEIKTPPVEIRLDPTSGNMEPPPPVEIRLDPTSGNMVD